jgi:hypothetical protein
MPFKRNSYPFPHLGSYTWANRPPVITSTGCTFFCSDLNVLFLSNGSCWKSVGGGNITLFRAGIPVLLPSSGTIGNNGALSGLTAFPATYNGGCYLYFPANAIAAGSAAGLYYTVMSSTTAGTIYNNAYTSGSPLPPANPIAFATTGPGSYTQTTASDITLLSYTIPGGLLNANGEIISRHWRSLISNANTKQPKLLLASTAFMQSSNTTNGFSTVQYSLKNMNSESKQIGQSGGQGDGSSSSSMVYGAIDTSANFTLSLTMQMATATDYAGYLGNAVLVGPES